MLFCPLPQSGHQGFHCDVVAPSLIPRKASDRVKTPRRDRDQLARLFHACELIATYMPDYST